MKRIVFVLMVSVFVAIALSVAGEGKEDAAMKLESPEFENNGFIPKKFTCQGENVNPALLVEGVPKDAKTLVLIVDDPDAPMGMWVHWVLYNVPVVSRIDEDSVPGEQGITDFGTKGYGGPCPPSGTHRYFFKIYALDTELDLKQDSRKKDLEKAMKGHILGKAEMVGLYKKH